MTHHSFENPKFESRNPKQILNPKKKKFKRIVSGIGFLFCVLNLIRISRFGFRIYPRCGGSASLSLLDPPYKRLHGRLVFTLYSEADTLSPMTGILEDKDRANTTVGSSTNIETAVDLVTGSGHITDVQEVISRVSGDVVG